LRFAWGNHYVWASEAISEATGFFLFTTPETLQIMLTGKRLRNNLRTVTHVVIDRCTNSLHLKEVRSLSIRPWTVVKLLENSKDRAFCNCGETDEMAVFLREQIEPARLIEVSLSSSLILMWCARSHHQKTRRLQENWLCSPETTYHLCAISELVDKHKSTLIFVIQEKRQRCWFRFMMLGLPIGVTTGRLSKACAHRSREQFQGRCPSRAHIPHQWAWNRYRGCWPCYPSTLSPRQGHAPDTEGWKSGHWLVSAQAERLSRWGLTMLLNHRQ